MGKRGEICERQGEGKMRGKRAKGERKQMDLERRREGGNRERVRTRM